MAQKKLILPNILQLFAERFLREITFYHKCIVCVADLEFSSDIESDMHYI